MQVVEVAETKAKESELAANKLQCMVRVLELLSQNATAVAKMLTFFAGAETGFDFSTHSLPSLAQKPGAETHPAPAQGKPPIAPG